MSLRKTTVRDLTQVALLSFAFAAAVAAAITMAVTQYGAYPDMCFGECLDKFIEAGK